MKVVVSRQYVRGSSMSGVRVNKVPFLVIITLLFSSLSPLIQVASATGQGTITIFSNGIPTSTINLNGSLANSSVSVTLERNTTIEHATFEISYDYALNSPSPGEVILDIGSDGQYEWAWNTLGYGDFGRQTIFSMGANNSSAPVNSAGNIIGDILIPSNAQVHTSDLTVELSPNYGGGWIPTGAIDHLNSGDIDGDNLSEPVFLQRGHNWPNGSNNTAIGAIDWASTNGLSNVVWTPTCDGAVSFELADFNGDNFSDVAAFDSVNQSACLLISQSNGTWASNTNFSLGVAASAIASGDLDGNGVAELISIHSNGELNQFVYDNQSGGFIAAASTIVSNNGTPFPAELGSVLIDDFWGTGNNNLVVTDIMDGHVTMWNISQGGWSQANPSTEFDCMKVNIQTHDWNGDGYLDLIGDTEAAGSGGTCSATFNGTGWITNVTNSTQLDNYTVGDWRGDGSSEILKTSVGTIDGNDSTFNGSIQVYSFGANGSLQTTPMMLYPHTAPRQIIISDLDGDGLVEHIVSAGESSMGLFIAGYHTFSFDFDMDNNSDGSMSGYAGDGQSGVNPLTWFDMQQSIASSLATNLPNTPFQNNVFGTRISTLRPVATSIGDGDLTFKDMNITYSFSAAVTTNPTTGNLSNSFNSLMECCSGTFNVPLAINSSSNGSLTLDNLLLGWVAGMSTQVFRPAPVIETQFVWWDVSENQHAVVLFWDNSAMNEVDFNHYQLFRWVNGTPPNFNAPIQNSIHSNMTFDNDSVSNQTWDYVVRAVYHNNLFSNYSEVETVVVPPPIPPDTEPPEAVEVLNATDVEGDNGGAINLSWPVSNSSDIGWYAVYYDMNPFSSISSNQTLVANFSVYDNTTSVIFNTSGDGVEYYFGLICGDLAGNVNSNATLAGPVFSMNNSGRESSLIFSVETGNSNNNSSGIVVTAGVSFFLNGTLTSLEEGVAQADYSIVLDAGSTLPPVTINGVTDSNGSFNHSWNDWLDFEAEHAPLTGDISATATFSGGTWGLDNQTLYGSNNTQQFSAITVASLSINPSILQLDTDGFGVATILLQAAHAVEQPLLTDVIVNYHIGNESNQAVSETGNLAIDSNGEATKSINYPIGGELDVSIPIPPLWLSLNSTIVRATLLPPPLPDEPPQDDNNSTVGPGPDLDLIDLVWSCDQGIWEATENGSSVGKACTISNPNEVLVHAEILITSLDGIEMMSLPTTATIFSNGSKNVQLSIKALDGTESGNYSFEVEILLSAAGFNSSSSSQNVPFTVIAKQETNGGNNVINNQPPPAQNQESSSTSTVALLGIVVLLVGFLVAAILVVRMLSRESEEDEVDEYLDDYDDYDYDEYEEEEESPPQRMKPLSRERPMAVQMESERESEYEDEYYDEEDEYYDEEDYTDSENYHVDEEGVEWWKDEIDVWWYRYPDEEEWSEFIE